MDKVCVYDPLVELMARFENVKAVDSSSDPFEGLSIEDRLKKHIVDGVKKNLERHIELALQSRSALSIVNDVLLDGMKTVGELFGSGKMQLPFVLQSAEVMKTAVRLLEPYMERAEGQQRGSILLATVAGDVHDIGKNLVDIILSNNGYRVVNIGIKQPIQTILDEATKHGCQVIGMSGLLVKSTLIMKDNLSEMNARGLHGFPVILGGAALTRAYVEQDLREVYLGQVHYAQDAFEGLSLMEKLSSASTDPLPRVEPETKPERLASHRVGHVDETLYRFDGVRSEVEREVPVPALPFYGARKAPRIDLSEVYRHVNPVALYRGQWQFRRPEGMSNPDFAAWLDDHAGPIFERKKRELAKVLRPQVKWGWFWCRSEGNDLIVYREDAQTERCRFHFPRQRDGKRLCLADFFRDVDSEAPDVVGLSVVTVGGEVSVHERSLFESGDYQEYLYTHGLGVEAAEGLAEYWHRQMRHELGIAGNDPADIKQVFAAKYRGSRYSFGYPACPNLEDQVKLFELLEPEDIGVKLTDGFMLEPEQSTSAVVVHHPQAKYFNVR